MWTAQRQQALIGIDRSKPCLNDDTMFCRPASFKFRDMTLLVKGWLLDGGAIFDKFYKLFCLIWRSQRVAPIDNRLIAPDLGLGRYLCITIYLQIPWLDLSLK